jgi:hypothetical protein
MVIDYCEAIISEIQLQYLEVFNSANESPSQMNLMKKAANHNRMEVDRVN